MSNQEPQLYQNAVAVLTSTHAKERAIAPILRDELGLIVMLAAGVDTDRFGTFSRDVARTGSQLDAARAKIAAGFDYMPSARVGLASEGSFGPHPYIPFLALGRELVLMVDRETGLELTGYDANPETNFGHAVAKDLEAALTFAARAGFPEHGLIVMGSRGDQPAPDILLRKDVTTTMALEVAVKEAVRLCGAAFVEADMRAHRNPTRMVAIERATRDLVRRYQSKCPSCGWPGFDITERVTGLPCAWCGEATQVIRVEVLSCARCGHQQERPATNEVTADPGHCEHCNP